jgi:tetratricopeptide (TPR) repeat protein
LILEESEDLVSTSMAEAEKTEALLSFMHRKLLKRYSLTQTRLDTLIDRGTYNCVSSAAFFIILTRYHGIRIEGIHVDDHAFCILPSRGDRIEIDIETTSEWGFDPGSRKEFHSSFTDKTGFVYVPPGNYRQRVHLGDKDMAGLILQNRIVELQKRNKHRDALTLSADRLVLTGSLQAQSDYFDTVQNAAALLNTKKDYLAAVSLINEASTGPYSVPAFLKNTRSQILYNACAEMVNNNKLQEAADFLAAQGDYMMPSEQSMMKFLIAQRTLELKVGEPFSRATINEIKQALDSTLITEARALSLAAYHYSLQAELFSAEGRHKEALNFLQGAPSWVQQDREYKKILNIIRDNTAIAYHNQMLVLINEGKKKEAEELLNEALDLIPGHSLLLQDKRNITR